MTTSNSNSAITNLLFLAGSIVLIISGGLDLTVTSEGNKYGTYFEETSIAAISIRSQGGLKLGLGIALLGVSGALITPFENSRKANNQNQAYVDDEMRDWDKKNTV